MKNLVGRVLPLLFVLMGCNGLLAQDSLKIGMKNNAYQYLIEKDYVKALPLYRELLKSFPKEPDYQYGVGVCLVNLNQELDEAINLLRLVVLADNQPMALYYLGRALHLNYSFDEAIKVYSRFLVAGKGPDIKSLDVERQIEMARNGLEFTHSGHSVNVLNSRTIQVEQLQLAAEINGSGKLMKKPAEFCSKSDLKADYRPWMFLPAYTEINEYIYVPGMEKYTENQKQLFRIKNINHSTWGVPESLGSTINTAYDEEFPYFDSRSSILYFSSKGHSSMGGYDIFRTVYDWNTKTWSKPENLGFPINSPADDYLFITDEFSHTASFASSRSTGPNQVSIYRIKLEHDTTGIRFLNVDEIRKASQLHIEPVLPAMPAEQAEELPLPSRKDYNKVLAEAMQLQLTADSLSRITRDKRILAKDSPDDAMKKQLVAEIIQSDKEAKYYQREADRKFQEARELKSEEMPVINEADTMIVLTKEINGIKVYQYKDTQSEADNNVPEIAVIAAPPAHETPGPPLAADEFVLLEKSPYSESAPIPQGLETYPGLVYRIQLGVFSKVKPQDAFGGISPVYYEQASGTNVLKYFAGLFHSLNAVNSALEQVRSRGFQDAFVVAFLDGNPISTEKAREIEFESFKLK